jgi:hypothetical protein
MRLGTVELVNSSHKQINLLRQLQLMHQNDWTANKTAPLNLSMRPTSKSIYFANWTQSNLCIAPAAINASE